MTTRTEAVLGQLPAGGHILCAVSGGVNGFEEAAEPLVEQLFAADLAFFQLTPQLPIDGAVSLHRLGVRLDAVIAERIGQRLAFGCIKIQQRIVCIEQDAIVFCHGSVSPLLLHVPGSLSSPAGVGLFRIAGFAGS